MFDTSKLAFICICTKQFHLILRIGKTGTFMKPDIFIHFMHWFDSLCRA